MIFKDYYKILGLKTNKVTTDEIKTAYREQAKMYHPDVNIGNSNAEERFKDINEAYRVLLEPKARRKYDRMWNTHIGSKNKLNYEESDRKEDSVFSDFFNMFFGNSKEIENNVGTDSKSAQKKKTPLKGEHIETSISISLEEAFSGVTKKISLRTIEGKMKTFTIKIPAGIRDNEKIRLIGQGKLGKNGGKNGDLFIKVNLNKQSKFILEGYDLHTDLFLNPWEAALGTRVTIQGIDEQPSVYIPQGIQSGEKVRLPSKGYYNTKGGRGDLVVTIKIMVPKKLSEEERELFEQLKEISRFNPRV